MVFLRRLRSALRQRSFRLLKRLLRPVVLGIVNGEIRVWGSRARLSIAPTAQMVNTLFNTSSGRIVVGDYTFAGHNASIITGTHRYESFLADRLTDIPREGRDVVVGRGVWIGSHAVILGPCEIGDHAVVASGAVVVPGTKIPPGAIVVGVPARTIRIIDGLPGR